MKFAIFGCFNCLLKNRLQEYYTIHYTLLLYTNFPNARNPNQKIPPGKPKPME